MRVSTYSRAKVNQYSVGIRENFHWFKLRAALPLERLQPADRNLGETKEMRRHIIIFAEFFFPSVGGVEVASDLLARVLAEQGDKVTLVTFTSAPEEVDNYYSYEVVRRPGWFAFSQLALNADLLIIQGGYGKKAILISLMLGKPFVLVHQMGGRLAKPRNYLISASGLIETIGRRLAKLHVAVSAALLSEERLNHKAIVIYNPVANEVAPPSDCTEVPRDIDILFVGRIISGKGVHILADALLLRETKYTSAAYVGVGNELNALRKRFADVGENRINFLGILRGRELSSVYRRAKIVVVPSTTHREGMGIVAAEAISNGCVVVSSDQPALTEVIGDSGISLANIDGKSLGRAINELLTDTEKLKKLKIKAIARSSIFSVDKFADQWAHLIDKIILR
jgi:glycogen(starch) synthase